MLIANLKLANLLGGLGEGLGEHGKLTEDKFKGTLSVPFLSSQLLLHKTGKKSQFFFLCQNKFVLCTDVLRLEHRHLFEFVHEAVVVVNFNLVLLVTKHMRLYFFQIVVCEH